MERTNAITFEPIKEALTVRGYFNPNLKSIVNGRNSLTMEDVNNHLFIKIYPDNTLMFNSIIAQHLIEDISFMPKLLSYSTNKDKIAFAAWELIEPLNRTDSKTNTSIEFDKIANIIYQIHKRKSPRFEYGPHFPVNDRRDNWKSYLKHWINRYISDSPREIKGFKKEPVLDRLVNYIDLLPVTNVSPRLLHGDINITNFPSKGDVIYTTDLDYSIIGDPAWEFASAVADWKFSSPIYHDILKQYMNLFEDDENTKKMFMRRIELYGPIKKIGLLYKIGDVSEISINEEMNKSIEEIKSYSVVA